MSSRDFLQDRKFLKDLDNLKIKEQYIKIIVLNWKEEPIQEIQGRVISGSVNLDGTSSMRRTASLSIVAIEQKNDLTNIDDLFAINKKCKIELGIVNTIPNYTLHIEDEKTKKITFQEINYKEKYGQIVWFPLGLYIMFNPSISHGTDGITISMQLKDKMCLLNGQIAGTIHSGVQFNYMDQVTSGDLETIEQKETLVYDIIKELVNHWGNEDLNKIIISEVPLKIKRVVSWTGTDPICIDVSNNNIKIFYPTEDTDITSPTILGPYKQYDDIGYTFEDFVPPMELTCNAGDTVTSVLDKIIGFMGNYEYFYDVDGNFIFQEKQNYLNMSYTAYWTKENLNQYDLPIQEYEDTIFRLNKVSYDLFDNNFTTNNSNSLNYNNIKNDFIVWGAKKSINEYTYPCRFHLAIDKKPSVKLHQRIVLYETKDNLVRGIAFSEKNFENIKNKEVINIGGQDYKIVKIIGTKKKGRTSKDWREEIYYQMLESEKIGIDTNTELNNSYFQYYAELKEEFPKIFNLLTQEWTEQFKNNPEKIFYYLDFIDENSELGKYSVNNIGRRNKTIEDNNEGINCVFEPSIPDIVYIDSTRMTEQEWIQETERLNGIGQRWTQIPSDIYDQFTIGGVLNSCYEKIKDLLYQYTHMNNSISISTIPLYYLQPGTRISVEDKKNGIEGDFIIQSITLPLDISSTMSINAYKAMQKI